jgi:glycosyltransferase involved in cell wall biosynthesis
MQINVPKKKKTYLINGWKFMYDSFRMHMGEFSFKFIAPKNNLNYYIENYLLMRKLYKRKIVHKFDVFHINAWETLLLFKRLKNQFSIFESHGFHPGFGMKKLNEDDKPTYKKVLGWSVDKLLKSKILNKINSCDLYYVSTPDMVKSAKKEVRSDAVWLPNVINTELFNPDGEKLRLQGNPVVFMPTRLHGDKMPEIGIRIFQDHIKKQFPDAALHLVQGHTNNFYEKKFKKELRDKKTYFWHSFMTREELVKFYRSADLILGQFNYGMLGLIELEAMACNIPVISKSDFEIPMKVQELPELAMKILTDEKFKEQFCKRNFDYVQKVHSPPVVCGQHLKNMKQKGFSI